MSTSDEMSHDEAISQFCGVTGADEDRARGLLEACEWNLELAINMHVDTDPEGRSNRTAQQQSTSSSSSRAQAAPNDADMSSRSTLRNNLLISDNDGDDEDSLNVDAQHSDSRGGRFANRTHHSSNLAAIRRFNAGTSSAESSAAAAAEAANAYSNLMPESDSVRPPIAPVRQILNPNPIGFPAPEIADVGRRPNTRPSVSNVFDAFRDFQAEAQWQEMLQDGEPEANGSESRRTLQALFRPPLELVFRGVFANARETGTLQNKWLLVNIQNGAEFACQVLNRDVWSHQTVKDIIKEHFIFWQVYHDTYEGQRYVQFYHVTKLPHVAIIDPRTGELVRPLPAKIDQSSFCDSVIEFLSEHQSPDGSAPDANTLKKLRVKEEDDDIDQDDEPQVIVPTATLYDQSEEAQLEAAIRASLQEPEKRANNDTIDIDDDTMEASDVSESEPLPVRDKEQAGKSPVSDSNSKSKNSNNSRQKVQKSENFSSPESYTPTTKAMNDSSTKTTDDQPNITAAEALKAISAEKPIKIQGTECRIALRFPDGSSHIQKFSASEQLNDVKEFVQKGKSIFRSSRIEFVAPPNRKFSESRMDETLEDLGLCPASRLEVKFVQD